MIKTESKDERLQSVTIRLPMSTIREIDALWIKKQDIINRSGGIRWLIAEGIKNVKN